MTFADLVFFNGTIITMIQSNKIINSVAVKNGIIIATGSKLEIEKFIGPKTELVDLEENTLTPGLINTHDHFIQHGIASKFILDIRYPKTKSIKEIVDVIEKRISEVKPGRWIFANVWDEALLEEHRYPTKYDIDPVSYENPVWLKRVFQAGVANSAALEKANITKDTPDPPFGWINRDEGGEPDGIIKGRASKLITDVIPAWTQEEKLKAIIQACNDYHGQGFTTLIEPGIMSDDINSLKESYKKKDLTMRILIQVGFLLNKEDVQWAIDTYTVGGDDNLRIIGLKYAVDGGIGPRTALVYEPYKDRPDHHGTQLIPDEELNEMVLMGHNAGFQVAIHAIGDKAIDLTMDAYTYAQKKSPRLDPRHQIVHCYFPTNKALKKIIELGVMVNTQTPFIWFLGDSFIEALGLERCNKCMPLKTFTKNGIHVGISHDATVTPPLSSIGLYSSVIRKTIKGKQFGIEESFRPFEAFGFYTTHAAMHCFMEDKIGTIEKGKYADLAIWDRNPLNGNEERLKELTCLKTYVNGKVVFSRE
jgi:predicted amidohydrolase YtcJ